MVNVRDKQRNRPPRGTRLRNRCRGGVDERVVRSEPSLLIEKNQDAPTGRALAVDTRIRRRRAGFDNRKSERPNDARENA